MLIQESRTGGQEKWKKKGHFSSAENWILNTVTV